MKKELDRAALEAAAKAIVEEGSNGNERWEGKPPVVQAAFRRIAQHAVIAYLDAVEWSGK